MTKSVIGGFQKIPKKNKYREDEWVKEKSKKKKPVRDKDKHFDTLEEKSDNQYEDDFDLDDEYNYN